MSPLPRQGAEAAALMRLLTLEAMAENPRNFITAYDEQAARPEQHYLDEIRDGWLFVAGEDQGMIVLSPKGWVHSAYVRPASRGRGYGDLLVASVVQTALDQGMAQISLGVFEENRHAVALYARHGFEVIKRTPLGARTDCVMERVL